jgi:hypothetical protein
MRLKNCLWAYLGLVSLLLAVQPSAAFDIVIKSPDVNDGSQILHDTPVLEIKGEIYGATAVEAIQINGRPAAVASAGSRDLVIEGLEGAGIAFKGTVVLKPGTNPIHVEAHADGQTAELHFEAELETTNLSGSAYALIVGIDDYADPRITDLRYAEADAKAVEATLTDPDHGVVPAANIRLLLGAEATARAIARAFEEHLVKQAQNPQDMVYFYFAGHGGEGPHITRGAAYYLIPQDAEVDNLLSTALEKGRLQYLWGAVPARRKIFITDACHSGGLQNMKVLSADGLEAVEGYITLAAAQADQQSWELPELGHGLFTHALTQGLKGAADGAKGKSDGLVDADEIGAYLKVQVPKMAAQIGAQQDPVIEVAPQADGVFLNKKPGQAPPPWQPPTSPVTAPFSGMVKVNMRFDTNDDSPYMLVALRDEDGDDAIASVAETALMEAFMAKADWVRFIEAGAVEGALNADQASLAFSDDPADLAAVARAVSADLILTGSLKTQATPMSAALIKRLGRELASFQAHLNVRVVSAHSGEIVLSATERQAGMHMEGTMAQRTAAEKASTKLAATLQSRLKTRWRAAQRKKPAGQIQVERLSDYQDLDRLGLALEELGLADLNWQSSEGDKTFFAFKPTATTQARSVAALLQKKGLSGWTVGTIKQEKNSLSFSIK